MLLNYFIISRFSKIKYSVITKNRNSASHKQSAKIREESERKEYAASGHYASQMQCNQARSSLCDEKRLKDRETVQENAEQEDPQPLAARFLLRGRASLSGACIKRGAVETPKRRQKLALDRSDMSKSIADVTNRYDIRRDPEIQTFLTRMF